VIPAAFLFTPEGMERLRFARWLVQTGRLTEHCTAEEHRDD
jgi:hypothetical protein